MNAFNIVGRIDNRSAICDVMSKAELRICLHRLRRMRRRFVSWTVNGVAQYTLRADCISYIEQRL